VETGEANRRIRRVAAARHLRLRQTPVGVRRTGTVTDISYFDVNVDPQHVDVTHVPSSSKIKMTLPNAVTFCLRKAA
jgi:hypothetical protein